MSTRSSHVSWEQRGGTLGRRGGLGRRPGDAHQGHRWLENSMKNGGFNGANAMFYLWKMVISWVLNGKNPIIHGDVNGNIMNIIYKWWIFHCDVCLPQGKHFHLGEGSWNGWFVFVAGDRNSDSEIPLVALWEPELESHPKQIFYRFVSSHAQPKICILVGGFKHDWIIFNFIKYHKSHL